jgi:hypothetical protein
VSQRSRVIVGADDDLHVQSVLEHCTANSVLVFDVQSLAECTYSFRDDSVSIDNGRIRADFSLGAPGRGWVRRLAPDDWQRGVVVGSLEAAEKTAWLSLMGAISRSNAIAWLTSLDAGLIAENKLHQLQVAKTLGLRTPRTLVSNSSGEVARYFASSPVVKALGPGHFIQDGIAHVLFTQPIDIADLDELEDSPPLLFQEHLGAVAHLRVVVVDKDVWVARLDAVNLPIDWRSSESAHDSFEAVEVDDYIRRNATAVNAALGIGYSSQDWIVAKDDIYLIDVNPGGQWLFLPDMISDAVSNAIAGWLGVGRGAE